MGLPVGARLLHVGFQLHFGDGGCAMATEAGGLACGGIACPLVVPEPLGQEYITLTGHRQASSLSRSVQRWYGCSPTALRRQVRVSRTVVSGRGTLE